MILKMKKYLISVVCALIFISGAYAQEIDSSRIGIGFIIGGDTVIHRDIREIRVYPKRGFRNQRFEKQYYRLVQRVKKVYPYALKANELLIKHEPEYIRLKTDREKRKLMKKIEEQLLAKYKDDLKKMSINDGKVLIKLIDRETGRTSYSIIRDFRGGIAAVFWQGIARIFSNNLKDEYDPYGEDVLIEEIVTMIESGYL